SFTVNETYFYRELHQLECLGRSLLPEIVARRGPGDLVRIWSVPCSTGDEPYSIALWLLENWPLVDAYH
ncbi:CheR family methyltransferase, partial [Klebsiella aerogenes]